MNHTSRKTFGALFQSVNQLGIGAEIGVQQGYNARRIFDSGWKGQLLCVDNWVRPHEFDETREQLTGYNAIFHKGDSAESASQVKNGSLDFVYIDADHSYEGVKADFNAWYGKVRAGGIVSGHDYAPETHKNDCDGVRVFIEEYMKLHPEIEMHFTTDDFYDGEDPNIAGNEYQSWWFVKP